MNVSKKMKLFEPGVIQIEYVDIRKATMEKMTSVHEINSSKKKHSHASMNTIIETPLSLSLIARRRTTP